MFYWTDEQKDLAEGVESWCSKVVKTDKNAFDEDMFHENWNQVRGMGIFTIPISVENGGIGFDLLTTMYVLERFGKHCDDAGLSFSVSTQIVSTSIPIQEFGTEAQRARYLPGLVSGELIGAHAMTETESGSDAFSMKTKAEAYKDGYIINGSKAYISNGPVADVFIVYVRTHPERGVLGGFSAFIVDKNTGGFTIGKPKNKMGLTGSPLSDLYFDDCYVDRGCLLGKEGNGFSMFSYVMKWEVLCSFIINVGEMDRLLNSCIEYSKSREQYGTPISNNQAISHKIANMKIGLETSRQMLYSAATKMLNGENTTTEIAIAKIVTSENFVNASLDAIQIFGGHGYMQESGIEQYLRNSVASKIYSGTSEIQRNTITMMLGL